MVELLIAVVRRSLVPPVDIQLASRR